MASRYDTAVKNFEDEDSEVLVRDRIGDCPKCGGVNTVKGLERRKANTVRVDVACTNEDCDFEDSRAGVTEESRNQEEDS